MTEIPLELLACPRCRAPLASAVVCDACGEFPRAQGQPVLIDFDRTILRRDDFEGRAGASPVPRSHVRTRLKRLLLGRNKAAESAAERLGQDIPPGGRVLVIGGGEIGSGAERLYALRRVTGIDIYPSAHTQIVADAHALPFLDEAFDAVWIQAVLEHVLDPAQVVAEIHRVLKSNGVVFADTPFLQHVHEGAYDFTRFTLSGHRWLFRRFELIEAGATSGAGTALLWAIRAFVRAVTGSRTLGRLAGGVFFWLSWFDGTSPAHEDVAGGTWLYARKSSAIVAPGEMVGFYAGRRGQEG
jgi:SAM-dependent methyltransferase